ncbi:MAG: MFS transporter [Clostridiales bacterium]|nr:MFS transporter [Candidatus Cacconaster stercorequi]
MTHTESIKRKEWIGYFMFCMGFPIFNNFVDSYIDLYLTDIGISAAMIGILVGVAQIFDGLNDPIFGILVDKRPFRTGKYRGWMLIAAIFMPLLTVLIFTIPREISTTSKIVWAFVAYLLYTTFYDTGDVPIFGVPTVMTSKIHERNILTGRRIFAGTLTVIAVSVAAPQLYSKIGWGTAAIVFAAFGFALMIPFPLVLSERNYAKEEQITIRKVLTAAYKNKYLFLYNISILILKLTNAVLLLAPFVARYCLKNDIFSTILYAILMLPIIPFSLLIDKITAKIDKFNVLRICIAGCLVTSPLCCLVGYSNIPLLLIFGLLRGIFFGPLNTLMYGFTTDIVEYGQYYTRKRSEGISLSFQTFCSKIGSGFQNTIAMTLLALFGFVSGAPTQTGTAEKGIWILYTLVPCIGYATSLLLLRRYKLRDKYVQIMQSANMGEISYETAEEKLKAAGFEK